MLLNVIIDADRKWKSAIEDWMLGEGSLSRAIGILQLYNKRNKMRVIKLTACKLSDDFLIVGTKNASDASILQITAFFVVGKVKTGNIQMLGGCKVV